METLKLTAADLVDGEYSASRDLHFDGHIEIAIDLRLVRFRGRLSASGGIFAGRGSGIEAGWGIKAGSGIEAGEGIKAGWGIKAGSGIEAGSGIKAGSGIEAGWVFSFFFEIRCASLVTALLPFWRAFYAAMPPLQHLAAQILSEKFCWDDLRDLLSREDAEKVCAWDGWHPIIRWQLEMFLRLKTEQRFDAAPAPQAKAD